MSLSVCASIYIDTAASLLALATVKGYHGYIFFACIYGFCLGGYQYALHQYTLDRIRARQFARAWAFVLAAKAVPVLLGVPIAGSYLLYLTCHSIFDEIQVNRIETLSVSVRAIRLHQREYSAGGVLLFADVHRHRSDAALPHQDVSACCAAVSLPRRRTRFDQQLVVGAHERYGGQRSSRSRRKRRKCQEKYQQQQQQQRTR